MGRTVRRIGLVLKRQDARVPGLLGELVPWLQSRGISLFVDKSSAEQYSCNWASASVEAFPSQVDAVVVFGGDGTLLYAARLVGGSGVPILGINLGSLGFLAEVKLEEMRRAFESLLAGDFCVQERMLLDVEVRRGEADPTHCLALNDAVINKGALARMIEFEIAVGPEVVTVMRADGLIVSTPTGSTAYSLSAGGPILYPTLEAVIITPICPHTLTNRPVVIPDSKIVEIRLLHGSEVLITVDGQVGMPLESGDLLVIRKAAPSLHLIQPAGSTFFKLLREKLKWG